MNIKDLFEVPRGHDLEPALGVELFLKRELALSEVSGFFWWKMTGQNVLGVTVATPVKQHTTHQFLMPQLIIPDMQALSCV